MNNRSSLEIKLFALRVLTGVVIGYVLAFFGKSQGIENPAFYATIAIFLFAFMWYERNRYVKSK